MSTYHAFALTQRGHGDPDKPECCYTPEDFAADIDAFMDALGLEEAAVVRASTGALFAQRAALRYPRRVSRLVLIGAQTPANEAVTGLVEEMGALEVPSRRSSSRSSRRAPYTSWFRKSSSTRLFRRASSYRPGYGAITWWGRCFPLTATMCSRFVKPMCRR